jgi:hypothetical protein
VPRERNARKRAELHLNLDVSAGHRRSGGTLRLCAAPRIERSVAGIRPASLLRRLAQPDLPGGRHSGQREHRRSCSALRKRCWFVDVPDADGWFRRSRRIRRIQGEHRAAIHEQSFADEHARHLTEFVKLCTYDASDHDRMRRGFVRRQWWILMGVAIRPLRSTGVAAFGQMPGQRPFCRCESTNP